VPSGVAPLAAFGGTILNRNMPILPHGIGRSALTATSDAIRAGGLPNVVLADELLDDERSVVRGRAPRLPASGSRPALSPIQ